MFKALLLATVAGAGVGAANVPAPELIARGKRQSSPFCSEANKKCPGPKAQASVIAYCSSLIAAKPATKTVRTTLYGTTTTTKTSVVATVTQPGSVVISTITSCAPPTTTTAGADNQKREAEPQYGYRHVPKPKCLECYKKDSDVTVACQCAVSPRTTAVTSTYRMTVEKTATVSATSTVTGDAYTTYVLPTQTFAVSDDAGDYYQNYLSGNLKDIRSGTGFNDDEISNAILFELNNANNIADSNGNLAAERVTAIGDDITQNSYRVTVQDPSTISSGQFRAITCSVSYSPTENTCPLVCQASSDADRNIMPNQGDATWYLGPPNSVVGTNTYKTYAVTRGQSGGRGGFGGSSQRRAMHRRA